MSRAKKAKPPVIVHAGTTITMRRCTDYSCHEGELAGMGGTLSRNEDGDPVLTFKSKRGAEKAFARMFNEGALNVRAGLAGKAIYLSEMFQPK